VIKVARLITDTFWCYLISAKYLEKLKLNSFLAKMYYYVVKTTRISKRVLNTAGLLKLYIATW